MVVFLVPPGREEFRLVLFEADGGEGEVILIPPTPFIFFRSQLFRLALFGNVATGTGEDFRAGSVLPDGGFGGSWH